MWNPPLITLIAFHWVSENSKPRVFFMHYLSTLKCKHCILLKIFVGLFKHIESFKYPGYRYLGNQNTQGVAGNGAKTRQLLRVTLGCPEYLHLCWWNTKIICQKYPCSFLKHIPMILLWLYGVVLCEGVHLVLVLCEGVHLVLVLCEGVHLVLVLCEGVHLVLVGLLALLGPGADAAYGQHFHPFPFHRACTNTYPCYLKVFLYIKYRTCYIVIRLKKLGLW